MWGLRSVTGAPYNIKVTVCHTAGHYSEEYTMTGTVTSSGRGGTAAAMAQNEQTAEEHSMLQQPPRRLDHPAWCVVWTVQPASTLKHSEDITGTEFSLELSASVVHGGVELCAPTSSSRTRDERLRWRQTAAVVTVVRKCQRELSCSSPPLWPVDTV